MPFRLPDPAPPSPKLAAPVAGTPIACGHCGATLLLPPGPVPAALDRLLASPCPGCEAKPKPRKTKAP